MQLSIYHNFDPILLMRDGMFNFLNLLKSHNQNTNSLACAQPQQWSPPRINKRFILLYGLQRYFCNLFNLTHRHSNMQRHAKNTACNIL